MEIKANELRIGNYILEDETIYSYGIRKIERELSLSDFRVSDDNWSDHWDMIKPIPLSEEWLFRLGFKHTKTEAPMWINSFCKRICCDGGNILIIEAKIEDSDKGLEAYLILTHARALRAERKYQYVHQLQNLYFALTNEELIIK